MIIQIKKLNLFYLLINLKLFHFILSICGKSSPYLKGSRCVTYTECSKEQLLGEECTIDNPTIKIQFLTNIIKVGDLGFRYINSATNLKGDIVLLISSNPPSCERKFYGLKNNGRFYFNNNEGIESPYYSYNITGEETDDQRKFEGETLFIELSNNNNELNNQEYLLSIAKWEAFVELYDFVESDYNFIASAYFFQSYIYSYKNAFFKLNKEDDINYYIFASISRPLNHNQVPSNNNLSIKKFSFSLKNISNNGYILHSYNNSTEIPIGKIISCFETKESLILCFFQNKYFNFVSNIYDQNLNEISSNNMIFYGNGNEQDENIYLKCIHYKEEIGVFSFYQSYTSTYPTISFKKVEGNSLRDYNSFVNINLNKVISNSSCMHNDIIKIDEYICYFSVNKEREAFNIILIKENDLQLSIKYYSVDCYKLYNYKFYNDIRIFSYNNFISLISSYCIDGNCNSDEDPHYASLIIFSYGNSSDFNFDIINYLSQTDININDLCFDLEKYTHIENNIFGLLLSGIKIINFSEDIELESCLDYKKIEKNYILQNKELFSLSFDNLNKEKYIIEFAPVLTDPSYEDMLTYIIDSDSIETKSDYDNNKKYYIGKTSYFTIFGINEMSRECDELCEICMNNNKTKCISCKYIGYKDNANNEKICFPNQCSKDIILDGQCHENINSHQIDEVYDILKEQISNGEFQNKSNLLIFTNNVVFQVSSYEFQKFANEFNVSHIDLGNCEKKLKQSGILDENDNLTIFKIDIKNETYSSTYVQYEIFNKDGSKQINLDICDDIIINVPTYLDDNIGNLFDYLNNLGHNLFDPHDSFYNDICSTYTSNKKTDVLLSDRQKYLFVDNSFCQGNCKFEFYNSSNNKALCKCPSQEDLIKRDIEKIDFCFSRDKMIKSFYYTLSNSNFRILKCYKLVFSINGQINNIGSYILFLIILIILILMIIYYIRDRKYIHEYIRIILNKKNKNSKLNLKRSNSIEDNSNIYNLSLNKNKKDSKLKQKNERKRAYSQHKKKKIQFSKDICFYNETKIKNNSMIKKNNNFPPKKKTKIINKKNVKIKHLVTHGEIISENKENSINSKCPIITEVKYSRTNNKHFTTITQKSPFIQRRKQKSKTIMNKKKIFNFSEEKKNNHNNYNNFHMLNDEELNKLTYEMAIKIDKRSYLQYYASLLKKKQLFLFTFCPSNDYNLITIKLSLFLISFSMFYVINGFFFNDNTMHKIFMNEGSFVFAHQLPQILISSIISFFINTLLKKLSLSEPKILELKQEEHFDKAIIKGKNLEKYMIIQFTIFFILSFVFLSFFWYYISCFCAVYKNTQLILIKDSLISFGISNLYPFMINFIPGIFRIHALRYPELKRKKLYQFSQIVALL